MSSLPKGNLLEMEIESGKRKKLQAFRLDELAQYSCGLLVN